MADRIKIKDLSEMSEEKLREISIRKGRLGNASALAKHAQAILIERNGMICTGHPVNLKYLSDEYPYDDL